MNYYLVKKKDEGWTEYDTFTFNSKVRERSTKEFLDITLQNKEGDWEITKKRPLEKDKIT